MYIKVNVFTNHKKDKIEKISDSKFNVYVKEKPVNNLANNKIIEILSDYFSVEKKRIRIINGHHSPKKMINIDS